MNDCTAFVLFLIVISYGSGAEIRSTMPSYDVIVIGLGSAGVSAASDLAQAGKKVLGLEAQDRIGGRVWTVPFGDGVVELGAEWIHGTENSTSYDLAIKNHVPLLTQVIDFEVFKSDGSQADRELLGELIDFCLGVMDAQSDKPETLGELITRKLNDYLKENRPELLKDQDFMTNFYDFVNLLVNSYEASNDFNDVTALSNYTELGGDQHMSWHRLGYKTFFDLLLNKYNNGPGLPNLDIKLNEEVTHIKWPKDSTDVVEVTCKNGDKYTAQNVIVTVSLGVLKERHASLFSPALPPEKVEAIAVMSMGLMNKIILFFDEPWWPKNRGFFGFFWRNQDRLQVPKEDHWTTRIHAASMPMGSNRALTLWATGDVAKLIETLPEETVKRKALGLLQRFMGANVTIPEPTAMLRSTWQSNPYTRGSYTYDNLLTVTHPNVRVHLGEPLRDASGAPRLLFAGEATHPKHFSTVHGASETGHREAARLLPQSKI